MDTQRTAIYPGTFDPVTIGHIDIMTRALKLFDKLVVGVAHSPKKHPLFSLEERVEFIKDAVNGLDHIKVCPFENLLIDFAAQHNATIIIRGLRAVTDFEFELQMGLMNRNLNESVETMFMIPSQEYSFLSSSFVKEIARHGGDISNMVPPSVLKGNKKLQL
ncbi:MAG: pantetheine-phosphate adenylyltransferase [Nitrospinota bacterium]|nr:pantetheine-phosphate adenylyltransferase [Nitrospinota bacterium]